MRGNPTCPQPARGCRRSRRCLPAKGRPAVALSPGSPVRPRSAQEANSSIATATTGRNVPEVGAGGVTLNWQGRAAFPKGGVAVLLELGWHHPLAAALGSQGESEMVLAKQALSAQPAHSLLLLDRYYRGPQLLAPLPATAARHFLVRVKQNLRRRLGLTPSGALPNEWQE